MVISSVPEPLYLQPPGLSQGQLWDCFCPFLHLWKAGDDCSELRGVFSHATPPTMEREQTVVTGGARQRSETRQEDAAKGGGGWGDTV